MVEEVDSNENERQGQFRDHGLPSIGVSCDNALGSKNKSIERG